MSPATWRLGSAAVDIAGNRSLVGEGLQREVEPGHLGDLAVLRRRTSVAKECEVIFDLSFGLGTDSAQSADYDFSELLAVDDQKAPQSGARGFRAAVPLAPNAVITEELDE